MKLILFNHTLALNIYTLIQTQKVLKLNNHFLQIFLKPRKDVILYNLHRGTEIEIKFVGMKSYLGKKENRRKFMVLKKSFGTNINS